MDVEGRHLHRQEVFQSFRELLVHTKAMAAPADTGMGLRAAEITANAV